MEDAGPTAPSPSSNDRGTLCYWHCSSMTMTIQIKTLEILGSVGAMHMQCTPIHHLYKGWGGGGGGWRLSELRPMSAFVDCTQMATLLQSFFCTAVPVIMPTSSALMGGCRTLYHSSLLILRAQHIMVESRPVSALLTAPQWLPCFCTDVIMPTRGTNMDGAGIDITPHQSFSCSLSNHL